ncbi:putative holin-like toxin [Effusibacillus consociatus]|uniref:Holin-like toxin n=1 Tax=Effusibacillus consociatus TaxID=1117041 RepID=A0ABV9Q1Q0_9BACL
MYNRIGSQGQSAHPLPEGGDLMTEYESISLMIAFGLLIVSLLSFQKRK